MKNASRKTEKLYWLRNKDGLMTKNPGIKKAYPQAPAGLAWNICGKSCGKFFGGRNTQGFQLS